jgi:type I restriction enzyme S subunit
VPQNDSNLWLNQRVGLFKNKINNAVLFIYYLFSKPEYQKALRDKGTGSSAQPNISATDIESIRILVPDINVLNDFAILANPMFNKVISNLRQIQLLAKTCDTLLPKLMSGQIRVK